MRGRLNPRRQWAGANCPRIQFKGFPLDGESGATPFGWRTALEKNDVTLAKVRNE